jgi:hypothetical protein
MFLGAASPCGHVERAKLPDGGYEQRLRPVVIADTPRRRYMSASS